MYHVHQTILFGSIKEDSLILCETAESPGKDALKHSGNIFSRTGNGLKEIIFLFKSCFLKNKYKTSY